MVAIDATVIPAADLRDGVIGASLLLQVEIVVVMIPLLLRNAVIVVLRKRATTGCVIISSRQASLTDTAEATSAHRGRKPSNCCRCRHNCSSSQCPRSHRKKDYVG